MKLFLKKRIKYLAMIGAVLVGVLLFSACGKKKKIENLKTDVEYALTHGNYDDAWNAYNEILELDKEDKTAIDGLKDLEKTTRTLDEEWLTNLHRVMVDSIECHMFDMTKGFKIPKPGDYSLNEFVSEAGLPFAHHVFEETLYVKDSWEFQSKLVSHNRDGKKLDQCEVRVAFYEYTRGPGFKACVYVTDSYDSENGELLTVGTKYKPSWDYSKSKIDSRIIGVHSHAFLVDKDGKQIACPKELEILQNAPSTDEENSKYLTMLNDNGLFQVWTKDDLKPSNLLTIGGCVLYDGHGNYYMELGLVSDNCYELQCISQEDAFNLCDFSKVDYLNYPRWNTK